MKITEPTTVLTDYLLGAGACVAGLRLLSENWRRPQWSVRLWALAFLSAAVAALAGGTSHGVKLIATERVQQQFWRTSLYSIGIASSLMLCGTIIATLPRRWRRWLLAGALGKFVLFAGWIRTSPEFRYVLYEYASSMLGILLLERRRKRHGSEAITAGILTSFVAGAVQRTGFREGKHFNNNDLYHLIQLVAVYLFYRGGTTMEDYS